MVPMHGRTTSQDIFEKVEQVLYEYNLDLAKVVCLATDGAANMTGAHNGVGVKLRTKIQNTYPNSSFVRLFTPL